MFNPIAYVRDTCGKLIYLGMFESVKDIKVSDDEIVLGINRASVTEKRREYTITKRGVTLYTFRKSDEGWSLADTLTVWWSTDEAHSRFGDGRQADRQWEELCYRPGTSRDPQDNIARREQGYDYR